MADIALSEVHVGADAEALVLEVLRSGHLAQGPMVERLELNFRELCGVEHAVAVSSGTTALVGALAALGIGPGDEVITSPFTFIATLNAILESGATARFADIDPSTFCVDPDSIRALVTPRTAAIMPVHLYGLPAPMPEIVEIASRHGLAIVEDAAQAHGATVADHAVGSFGVGCFSLYATKNVTSGEGGIVTTDDATVADRLRLLRNQGMRERYQYELPGHNWRLTDIQAAVALPQLDRLERLTSARRANADRLSAGLATVAGLVTPTIPAGRTHVFHQYTVRVGRAARRTRDELSASLSRAGIGNGVYYPRLVHDYDCYRSNPHVVIDATPQAHTAAGEVLSLPVHPALVPSDLERVIESVRSVLAP